MNTLVALGRICLELNSLYFYMSSVFRALAVTVEAESRRSVLVDVLTVYGASGKSMVFTQTKRDADEVAAGINKVMPCEVGFSS